MTKVADIYTNGAYAGKNPTFGDNNADWKISNALKAIRGFGIPHQTIAEVGCGGGAIIKGVSEALGAEKAVGFEPMPEAFAVAKGRETEKLEFRNHSVDESTPDRFDLVLCFDVFEHIEDYIGFLRSMRGLGRHFLFHVPLDMNVQMVWRARPIDFVRKQVGHLHYFSKETTLATLRDAGYETGDSFYTFGADGTYSSLPHRLLKYPRKLCYLLDRDLTVRVLGGYSLMVHAQPSGARDAGPSD